MKILTKCILIFLLGRRTIPISLDKVKSVMGEILITDKTPIKEDKPL